MAPPSLPSPAPHRARASHHLGAVSGRALAGLATAALAVAVLVLGWTGCHERHDPPAAASAPAPAPAVPAATPAAAQEAPPVDQKLILSDDEWRKRLTPEQYLVLRRHGTEPAFCGGYTATKHHGPGTYHCAGCGNPLFTAETKFESGSGWPSFFQPIPGRVEEQTDTSHGMIRTEIHCARCGGHLGHVFDDGPAPTGLRYCINAVSLSFTPATGAGPATAADKAAP
jgi:peptide-methionine (R)-S-oxide reductase